jgi:hypothetical protein
MFEEISDELLQARLEEFKAGESQQKWAQEHRVAHLCINPNCKEALLCNEPDCAKCEAHEVCPAIPLSGLSKMLNEIIIILARKLFQRSLIGYRALLRIIRRFLNNSMNNCFKTKRS